MATSGKRCRRHGATPIGNTNDNPTNAESVDTIDASIQVLDRYSVPIATSTPTTSFDSFTPSPDLFDVSDDDEDHAEEEIQCWINLSAISDLVEEAESKSQDTVIHDSEHYMSWCYDAIADEGKHIGEDHELTSASLTQLIRSATGKIAEVLNQARLRVDLRLHHTLSRLMHDELFALVALCTSAMRRRCYSEDDMHTVVSGLRQHSAQVIQIVLTHNANDKNLKKHCHTDSTELHDFLFKLLASAGRMHALLLRDQLQPSLQVLLGCCKHLLLQLTHPPSLGYADHIIKEEVLNNSNLILIGATTANSCQSPSSKRRSKELTALQMVMQYRRLSTHNLNNTLNMNPAAQQRNIIFPTLHGTTDATTQC